MSSPNVALLMGVLCMIGGITGYSKKKSIMSLAAGCSVGALYLWSGYMVLSGANVRVGYKGAFYASVVLFLSSAPRALLGPVPAGLALASSLTGYYYRNGYNL